MFFSFWGRIIRCAKCNSKMKPNKTGICPICQELEKQKLLKMIEQEQQEQIWNKAS